MRREDVQIVIAALVSTLGAGHDGTPGRPSQGSLAACMARGLAAASAPVPGRLDGQVRRAMLQGLQLILQCYGAWRDGAIVIDAELRRIFQSAAGRAVGQAIEETGGLCAPEQALAARAVLPTDLDAVQPAALAACLTDIIEGELLAALGDTDMPLSFRDFLRGAGSGTPGWHDAFTLYLAWEVKNEPEPVRSVLAATASDAGDRTLALLHEGLIARAPGIAQRFDAFLKSAREAPASDAAPYRLTERARFVDIAALQAWHLAARMGVPPPALVACLEPICRRVGAPVDVETELHHATLGLADLWAAMGAAAERLPPVGDAAHALAQGDLAAAQQALSAAFAYAASAVDRAGVRRLEGSLQSLAGLWRHASRSFMAAADLLKDADPEASLSALVEVAQAFIREADQTGEARAAETAVKLAENIVASAATADPALRAEAGLVLALAHLAMWRTSARARPVKALLRLVRRAVPLQALAVAGPGANRAVLRIAEEVAGAARDGDSSNLPAAADLITALRHAREPAFAPRDEALLLACLAGIRAPASEGKVDVTSCRDVARLLTDALARVSRAEWPYLWSALQGHLGQALSPIAKSEEGEESRATRQAALIAFERALQECGHDRGGGDGVRHLTTIAHVLAAPRTETASGALSDRAVLALRTAEALLPETAPATERLRIAYHLANLHTVAGRHASGRSPRAAKAHFEQAIARYRHAIALADSDESSRGTVRLLMSQGRALGFLAELERSRPRYEEAIAVYEQVLKLTADRPRQSLRTRAEEAIGELRQLVDAIRRAETRLQKAN